MRHPTATRSGPDGSRSARRSPLQLTIGFSILLLALFYLYHAFQIRVPPIGDSLGPRFFPLMLGGMFVLFCLANIVMDIVAPHDPSDERPLSGDVKARTAGTFAAALLYATALPVMGYLAATALLIAAFLALVRFRGVPTIVFWSLLLTAVFYLVFDTWLGVKLPGVEL
ncbi:tripartite tricarboxylate transporter TctB family protein [Faunimonas sp. B44]|uniref:tripartite tricarboxylate transporter TctB family protein n=1 Tax=Faunimonas sp. B44 TaxID=3461493 RepID=UPI00404497F7